MAIEGEVTMMPNGTVTTTVLAFNDGRVELEEMFMVTGMVMNSGLIANGTGREFPVDFQNSLTVSINSDDGMCMHSLVCMFIHCMTFT